MSAPEDDTAPPKRRKWKRKLAYAVGGVAVAGGIVTALGPAAPWIIDNLADGRRVWRLGNIQVDGVSGSWLGALRAERVVIADEEGVWIEAHNIVLDWAPHTLLAGGVELDLAQAESIVVLRQPRLLERRPSSGADFGVRIDSLAIGTLTLEEPVLGQAATFTADLKLDLRGDDLRLLDLTIQRTDSDADRVLALYRPDEDYAFNIEVEGEAGGILSRALRVPEQSVRASATGDGSAAEGSVRYDARLGDTPLLNGASSWTAERWETENQLDLEALPQLATIARRIGPRATLNASGERIGAFEAHAETPFLALDLSGVLDAERALVGPARFVATTQNLSAIARESPFTLGAARLEGELRQARGTTAIQANLNAQQIEALGQRVRLTGPVRASLTDAEFSLEADLRAPERTPALFAQARLETELSFDRRRGRFELSRAALTGDALVLQAQGWTNNGDGEFAGEWRVRQLNALSRDLRGQVGGRWRAFAGDSNDERVWNIAVDGAGSGVGGSPNIVPQLLGATPRLDARLAYENRGITVSHARIEGANLRAGATGRIVNGEANLALEASARGPLNLGGATIDGAVDATGRLTGRIARPTITASAAMSSFAAGGGVVAQPQVDFTLGPNGRGYVGRAEVQGDISGQPMTAAANVAIVDNGVSLDDLLAQVAGLEARGSASVTPAGASADVTLTGALDDVVPGVSGRISGDLALTPDRIVLDAQLMDARAGELWLRAATLRAVGPLNAIAARFELRGRLRQAPLAFGGDATISRERNTTTLLARGEGTLADAAIRTRTPIRAEWSGGAMEAALDVAIADGAVHAQWQERGRALAGSATIEDAPLAPLAAIWGERAVGRIDGRIALANSGNQLSGDADITLDDARLAGRQRGMLDMHIVADLDPSRLTATVDASSTEGLVARFEADAPVVTSTAPIRIALAPERRGRATWSVRGPAESLWAATRLQDQLLSGQLDGEGELQFGAGYLSGAGGIEIRGGRFEDKLSGVTLVNLDARVGIGDSGIVIERFTANGPRGGTITATGGSANQREGRIVVNVNDMRVADRPDARARASGELTLTWEGLNSSLSGALNIIEAEVDIATNPEAGIPTLDVVEINRPGMEDETFNPPEQQTDAPRRNGSTALNVRINAPGRIFTRGRGVDAEWSLNLRLQGTSRNPQVFGEARAIRGTLALSGQPFEIEDARIFFDGDPLDATIDMTAVRDTADLTARIRLTGTARDPELAFSSDPPLPEDEILPQVLFGRSVEDLSALEAAQLAASLAALSGRASLDLVDAARAAAGLDRFNVRQDEDGGFLVAGGVYLTREVYVEVARTGLGQAQTRVEWTIRPRLVLITSFLGNGDQRVSLRWRRESNRGPFSSGRRGQSEERRGQDAGGE